VNRVFKDKPGGSLTAMGSPYKALVAFTDVVKDAKDG